MTDLKIHKTIAYDFFNPTKGNRGISKRHVQDLVNSILKKDLLSFNPIIVNKNNEIIDGQHRIEAAKMLKIPVYYVISEDSNVEDTQLLNKTLQAWTIPDFVRSFVEKGYKDYEALADFCKTYSCSISIGAGLLSNATGYLSHQLLTRVRSGKFKIVDKEAANILMDKILRLSGFGSDAGHPLTRNRDFIAAVTQILTKTSFEDLFDRLIFSPEKFNQQVSKIIFMEEIERLYNKGNDNPKHIF